MATDPRSDALTRLAQLLRYPEASSANGLGLLPSIGDEELALCAEALHAFDAKRIALSVAELQEEYTRAFDLGPLAIPYVSVHLYGEESFKRGRMMAWLNELYAEHSYPIDGELPDHLQHVLGFAATLSEQEREAFLTFCTPGPVAAMLEQLSEAGSPYAEVLRAVQALVGTPPPDAPAPSWEMYVNSLNGNEGRTQWEEEFRD